MSAGELLLRAKEVLLHARDLRHQRARLLEEKAELLAAREGALAEFRQTQQKMTLCPTQRKPASAAHISL